MKTAPSSTSVLFNKTGSSLCLFPLTTAQSLPEQSWSTSTKLNMNAIKGCLSDFNFENYFLFCKGRLLFSTWTLVGFVFGFLVWFVGVFFTVVCHLLDQQSTIAIFPTWKKLFSLTIFLLSRVLLFWGLFWGVWLFGLLGFFFKKLFYSSLALY